MSHASCTGSPDELFLKPGGFFAFAVCLGLVQFLQAFPTPFPGISSFLPGSASVAPAPTRFLLKAFSSCLAESQNSSFPAHASILQADPPAILCRLPAVLHGFIQEDQAREALFSQNLPLFEGFQ